MKVSIKYYETLEENLKEDLAWLIEQFAISYKSKTQKITQNAKESKRRTLLEEIIVIEELPMEFTSDEDISKAIHEEIPEIKREKDQKRALKKLIKKSKYNAKYLNEIKHIENVKNQMNFRRYILY